MKYEPHLVAFLDILGFSQICLSSEKSEKARNQLKRIFEYCEDIKESFRGLLGKEKIDSVIISDSIVLTLKLNKDKPSLNEIRNFVLASGQFQLYLAQNGVFLRGGISWGQLYVDKARKQIVGPAFIKAYNLEKSVSKYPRIVADTSLILDCGEDNAKEFKKALVDIQWDSRLRPFYDWSALFDDISLPRVPHDVPLIVDFIRAMHPVDFKPIAEHVSHGLNGPIEYYEKYRWLADYLLVSFHHLYSGMGPNRDYIQKLLT